MTTSTDVIVLDDEATPKELKKGEKYLAQVNNVENFGVFVSLTPGYPDGTDISGLVHQSNLPALTQPREFEIGDKCAVVVEEFKDDGDIAFVMDYAENVESGASGAIPDAEIIDVERRKQSATPKSSKKRAPRNDQVDELRSEVSRLQEAIEELTGSKDEFNDPAMDAVRTVNRLRRSGATVEKYEKQTLEGGDTVRLEVEFDRS